MYEVAIYIAYLHICGFLIYSGGEGATGWNSCRSGCCFHCLMIPKMPHQHHLNFRTMGWALSHSLYIFHLCCMFSQSMEKCLRKFQTDAKESLPGLDLESQMLDPESLRSELSCYEKEIAIYKERNAALQHVLEDREEEIQKSKVAICAYQEERDKLQRKVI